MTPAAGLFQVGRIHRRALIIGRIDVVDPVAARAIGGHFGSPGHREAMVRVEIRRHLAGRQAELLIQDHRGVARPAHFLRNPRRVCGGRRARGGLDVVFPMAGIAGRGGGITLRDPLAVDAPGVGFGHSGVTGAAGVLDVEPIDRRCGIARREDVVRPVAAAARRGGGVSGPERALMNALFILGCRKGPGQLMPPDEILAPVTCRAGRRLTQRVDRREGVRNGQDAVRTVAGSAVRRVRLACGQRLPVDPLPEGRHGVGVAGTAIDRLQGIGMRNDGCVGMAVGALERSMDRSCEKKSVDIRRPGIAGGVDAHEAGVGMTGHAGLVRLRQRRCSRHAKGKQEQPRDRLSTTHRALPYTYRQTCKRRA